MIYDDVVRDLGVDPLAKRDVRRFRFESALTGALRSAFRRLGRRRA